MQAPQLRLNERQANPNPYVIFIRSLRNKKDHTDAEDILKAVAAQMKTIMRDRFMQVHTLEEAAFNRVFAGRNWNHGQSIELVLRGPSGRFLPMAYIISVMCHEMAHIEQMNHGPKFQRLMAEIKADVSKLQAKGYYGDGFWSDGKRLADSVRMGGEGLRQSDFPEYICGVSAADARKARRPNRGPGASQTPGLVKGEASHRSGRQTEYKRKAGRRNNADMGEVGARLDGGKLITKEDRGIRKSFIEDRTQTLLRSGVAVTTAKKRAAEMFDEENPWWKEGSTTGKTAKSKTAAGIRAAAAEARLRAIAGPSSAATPDLKPMVSDEEDGRESEEEDEKVLDPKMDAEERRREMEDEMDQEEREGLRGGWEGFVGIGAVKVENGIQTSRSVTSEEPNRKRAASPMTIESSEGTGKQRKLEAVSTPNFGTDMIREERLKALGSTPSSMASAGRPLGKGRSARPLDDAQGEVKLEFTREPPLRAQDTRFHPRDDGRPGWRCKVCTFINLTDHGRCEMCQSRPDGTMPSDVII
ncbi:hypothetical protein IAR55_001143 [Kwoniella newhampshirensis]|uniref:WLM domain-containing protein n=1 Tax=Kwoniella newhampshirensis TaxID=1651941 RepID=A0AAW0Z4W8_9TREE